MKTFVLDDDMKITVEDVKIPVEDIKRGLEHCKVTFYEYYESCGWRMLTSELWEKRSAEWKFGITL